MPLTLSGNGTVSGVDWGASGSGLVKIVSQPIAASTISISNCFTSAYNNYVLVFHPLITSANGNVEFRLRANGVDATTTYSHQQIYASTTTVGAARTITTSAGRLGQVGNLQNGIVAQILGPQLTYQTTYMTMNDYSSESTLYAMYYTGAHATAASYDGITIFHDTSATLTGTIRIYGYTN